MDTDIFMRLAAPFSLADIEWRAGATNGDKTRALALAYITARAAMDRLDEVVGPSNWRDDYKPGPDGGLICGISLRIEQEWITKWDGAENTQFEAIKGGLSDAFKRAAVKWGIGRYLYRLPNTWVPCEVQGKNLVLKTFPELPAWALRQTEQPSGAGTLSQPASLQPISTGDHMPVLPPPPSRTPLPQSSTNGNGKRPASWSATVVEAVIRSGLSENAQGAVMLLNQSGIPREATPQEAVSLLSAN